MNMRKGSVRFDLPFYPERQTPRGFLPHDIVAHGLFYYYMLMKKNLEWVDGLVYEGEADRKIQPRALFVSIAKMYGVPPEILGNYWPAVDMECWRCGWDKLPDVYKYNSKVATNS